MKTIIAGSREIDSFTEISAAVKKSGFKITEVVSGTARGVDKTGEAWASYHNIPVKPFPADWNGKGYFDPGAGMKRNHEMGDYADALIAVWDGSSKGTKDMIDYANGKGLQVFVYIVNE